jgi:hypothetical protein
LQIGNRPRHRAAATVEKRMFRSSTNKATGRRSRNQNSAEGS